MQGHNENAQSTGLREIGCRRLVVKQVGDTGFEPVTPSV